MTKQTLMAAALVLLMAACTPVQKIKCDPITAYVDVPVNTAPADVGKRPSLETRSITTESKGSDVITAYADDLANVETYAKKLECALAPFQVAAGVSPSISVAECNTKPKVVKLAPPKKKG